MTPDVEEMAAIGAAMLTANEVEQLLGKVLPEGPSAKAIQNAVRRLGEEIETEVWSVRPLSTKGDVLAVSWDGVMTPIRETNDIAWREAGVATVSIYGQGEEGPEKLNPRFLARMPESGMKTLLEQIVDQVVRAKDGRSCREFAILCDDKETIWAAASSHPELRSAVWIPYFYHPSEKLMKAANALFGLGTAPLAGTRSSATSFCSTPMPPTT